MERRCAPGEVAVRGEGGRGRIKRARRGWEMKRKKLVENCGGSCPLHHRTEIGMQREGGGDHTPHHADATRSRRALPELGEEDGGANPTGREADWRERWMGCCCRRRCSCTLAAAEMKRQVSEFSLPEIQIFCTTCHCSRVKKRLGTQVLDKTEPKVVLAWGWKRERWKRGEGVGVAGRKATGKPAEEEMMEG